MVSQFHYLILIKMMKFGVFEIGMNKKREIDYLAIIIKPNLVL